MSEQIAGIQQRVRLGLYRLSSHAEREREADQITKQEMEEALLSTAAEIIEDYPGDPRGPSCLVLGFTSRRKLLHIVIGVAEEELIIITVYRPSRKEWIGWKRRRGATR